MQIPSYQIQNILKNHIHQLGHGKVLSRNLTAEESQAGNVSISTESSRAKTLEKVAAAIVERITAMAPRKKLQLKIPDQIHQEPGEGINFTRKKEKSFSFINIDRDNVKTIRTLWVED